MKQKFFGAIIIATLTACSGSKQIIQVEDKYLNLSSLKLEQVLNAYSDDIKGDLDGQVDYEFSVDYIFEQSESSKQKLIMNLQIVTNIRPDRIDSVMFLDIDYEKIRLSVQDYREKEFLSSASNSTEAGVSQDVTINGKQSSETTVIQTSPSYKTRQMMRSTVVIPQNLWEPLANCKTLFYRLYIGKEGIDIKVDTRQLDRLKQFMQMAVERKHKSAVLPEGMKKW